MKTTFLSSLSLWNSPRSNVARMQTDLVKANKEVSSGRFADVGLHLGYKSGQGVSLRQDKSAIEGFLDSNNVAKSRLNATRISLDSIRSGAEDFVAVIVSRPAQDVQPSAVSRAATDQLKSLIDKLNISTNGQRAFAGTNTGEQPVADYFATPTSAAKTAVDDAFVGAFGFAQNDPSVSMITAADMGTFLDTTFAALFDEAAWTTTWSSASSSPIQSKISETETINTSVTANMSSVRKLAMGYTMAMEFANVGLSAAAQDVLIAKVVSVIGSGMHDLIETQADLGNAENKIGNANERLFLRKDVLDTQISDLESVDPAEAKTRVDALTTQIQISYSLTAQIQKLSLINYIS